MLKFSQTQFTLKSALIILVIAANFYFAFTARAHFALAPKIQIAPLQLEASDSALIRFDNLTVSRDEFSDYLQRITAFDTKYDRIQSNFFSHFEIIRGIAFFHPNNVHKYIDTITSSKQSGALHQLAISHWFQEQADIFARAVYFINKADKGKLIESSSVREVIDFYAAGAKTEFVEELIVLGDTPPSVEGLTSFVLAISPEKRRQINTGIVNDTEITPIEEQKRIKKRWSDFRQEILKQANAEQQCNNLGSPDDPPDSLLITVNQRKITLGDYLAIFGKPRLDRQWNAASRVNCHRLVLFYSIADLADQLGIVPKRVTTKINTSKKLYLAAYQIVSELGPSLVEKHLSSNHQAMVRSLMTYPEVVNLKNQLLTSTQNWSTEKNLFIDDQFLSQVSWELKRTLSPKHSIHF